MGSATRRAFAFAVTALALSLPLASPAHAADAASPRVAAEGQKPYPESGEVLMQADDLVYDRDKRIVTATGHVEISYSPRVLMADKVTYDQNTGDLPSVLNGIKDLQMARMTALDRLQELLTLQVAYEREYESN